MIYVALSNNVRNHVLTLTKSILRSAASLNTKVSAILFSTLALFLEVLFSKILSETSCSEFFFFLFPRFTGKYDEALTVYFLTYFAFTFCQC
jgi:hypothetical protein